MEPERSGFYARTLQRLLGEGVAGQSMRVLVVAGGELDREVFRRLGFEDVTVTNVEDGVDAEDLPPWAWGARLGWEPTVAFDELVALLVDAELDRLRGHAPRISSS